MENGSKKVSKVCSIKACKCILGSSFQWVDETLLKHFKDDIISEL